MEYSTRNHETWTYAAVHKTSYVTMHKYKTNFYVEDTKNALLRHAPDLDINQEEIDLTSEKMKFLFLTSEAFFHFFVETMALIYKLIKERPNEVLVIYVTNLFKPKFSRDLEELLRKFLDKQEANYVIIRTDPETGYAPIVKVDNYTTVHINDNQLTCSLADVAEASELLVKCASEVLEIDRDSLTPIKKVFLTNPPSYKFNFVEQWENGSLIGYKDDLRIHDREKLEKFFSDLGYEVIDPEETFESLFHQIVYMARVKTLAAVTCSGLANMLFMSPGQLIVEIQAEVVQVLPNAQGGARIQTCQSVHTMYAALSFIKNHFLISIPSHRDPEPVIEKLKASSIFKLL